MLALTFNFPYRQRGESTRDPDSVLEEWIQTAADWLKQEHDIDTPVLGGKSLGARIASQVVASGSPALALVFLGYPLHPPRDPSVLRDTHLFAVNCPMRFVHGMDDQFAYPRELDGLLERLQDAGKDVALDRIEGTHGLRDAATGGRTANQWNALSQGCVDWLARFTGSRTGSAAPLDRTSPAGG
jgi:predicted alpha/beta-hydrolase family hydrolase